MFDFSLVDALINRARQRKMKLAFLWFGAWKNAQCYYAPSWVKTDLNSYKRAQVVKGKNARHLDGFPGMHYTSLSYLCEETKAADANAFSKLLRHIKEVDGEVNTVIAVQVENETGLQGAAREHSDEADKAFSEAVPQAFVNYMKKNTSGMHADIKDSVESGQSNGSWSEVFGVSADEIFSAYHVASYVNTVAKAGKAEYPLPMLVNCWLDNGGKPGDYPSGGPITRVLEVWRYCAPEIDIFAPDIYVRNFCDICDEYTRHGNPLFIPETATHSYSGPRLVYVVGHHHALCYSPFGFEGMGGLFTIIEGYLFGIDTKDPALSTPQDVNEYRWYTTTLSSMKNMLIDKYGTKDLQAVTYERKENNLMEFGSYGIKVLFDVEAMITRKDGVCLVLKQSYDEFYIIAVGCLLVPYSTDSNKPFVDILCMEEGQFVDGKWVMRRRLNGDEVTVKYYNQPVLLRLKLFAYN
jgi:hypothetical protein